MDSRIRKTMDNLEKNNMKCFYLESKKEVETFLDSFIKDNEIVGVGGSQTLFECDVINYLRKRNITFLDRYKEGITPEERKQVFRQSFSADYYLASSNAITEDGYLYNVDGTGNRVAAMVYGPDKVIIIVGVNKIVENIDAAVKRIEEVAAPLNAKRLNQKTPCNKFGTCQHCNSKEKICRDYVLIKKPLPNRFTILIVNEKLGY